MRFVFFFFLLLFYLPIMAQDIKTPKNWEILQEVDGDLDKDGIPEKVVAYTTDDTSDSGNLRELRIFKKYGASWTVWKKSRNAILRSEDGGMMGDPFGNIKIKEGLLLIHQNGGSSWKWAKTDKYRYQNNEFELIGYTSTFGKPCEYWTDIDFNISTAQVVVKKEYEDCENMNQVISRTENEKFKFKLNKKITLTNRNKVELTFFSPKYKHELNL